MTNTMHALGAAVAASALLLPAAAMAAPAHPSARATRSWDTLQVMEGGKHQACRKLVDGGSTFRVLNRMDARHAAAPVGAEMKVKHDGSGIGEKWRSGLVADGNISAVGSVDVPRGKPGYTLSIAIYQSQAGGGDEIKVGDIDFC